MWRKSRWLVLMFLVIKIGSGWVEGGEGAGEKQAVYPADLYVAPDGNDAWSGR